jgi:hypothetical protein
MHESCCVQRGLGQAKLPPGYRRAAHGMPLRGGCQPGAVQSSETSIFLVITIVVECLLPDDPGPPGVVPPDPTCWVVVIALWTSVTMQVSGGLSPIRSTVTVYPWACRSAMVPTAPVSANQLNWPESLAMQRIVVPSLAVAVLPRSAPPQGDPTLGALSALAEAADAIAPATATAAIIVPFSDGVALRSASVASSASIVRSAMFPHQSRCRTVAAKSTVPPEGVAPCPIRRYPLHVRRGAARGPTSRQETQRHRAATAARSVPDFRRLCRSRGTGLTIQRRPTSPM